MTNATQRLIDAAASAKVLARRLSNAAFNAGVEDAGDAWTRQEKTAVKAQQALIALDAAIDALAAAPQEAEQAPTFSTHDPEGHRQAIVDYEAERAPEVRAEHVGDTRFEGWISEHARTPHHIGYSKQDMRACYWAGYSERASATSVQEPNEIEAAAKAVIELWGVTPRWNDPIKQANALYRLAYAIEPDKWTPKLANGLTEAETSATRSVSGLTQPQAESEGGEP